MLASTRIISCSRIPLLLQPAMSYRAIRVHHFGAPEQMQIEDVQAPALAAGQVLVAVKAAGVNPVDTYIRSGNYARKPALPYTPGADGAGIVEAVGPDVTSVSVGDRVYLALVGAAMGTYATKAVVDATAVHPLPESVSFAQGAGLNVPYATAYRALFTKGRAKAGETVLIHGASGGVGIAAVQLAKAAGLTVIGTAGSADGEELVRKEGADHVLNHRGEGYLNQIHELTNNRGVDVVVEMAAHVNLGKALPYLAPQGRLMIVGSRGPVEINPRDLMGKESSITGVALGTITAEEYAETHAAIVNGLRQGHLRPVVGTEYQLEQAAEAHKAVMEQSGGAKGKIVLVMN